MRNVRHILRTGGWSAFHAWYPSLSHLPLAVILKLSLWTGSLVGFDLPGLVVADGSPGPWAFWIGRWLSAIAAAGVVLWTYFFAARAFSRDVGLLASVFIVASVAFAQYASTFKPDMLSLVLMLLAFSVTARSLERDRVGLYLLTGVLIGLAASAKQTGALAAVPLVSVTILRAREKWRWPALAGAGIVSILVFLALNPDLDNLRGYLAADDYYRTWAADKPTPYPTLVYLPVLALDLGWHGPVVGAAAWLGLVVLGISLTRSRLRGRHDGAKALMVAFVVIFPLVCAAISSHPKYNIFLPTLPFTAVSAAWLLTELWGQIGVKIAARYRGAARLILLAALLTSLGIPFARYAVDEAIRQTTNSSADARIRADVGSVAHRTTVFETSVGAPKTIKRFHQEATLGRKRSVEELFDLEPLTLDLADYEIFSPVRLSGPNAEAYQARIDRLDPASVWRIEPRLFTRRGDPQIVLAHPWTKHAEHALDWKKRPKAGRGAARLPRKLRQGRIVSFDLVWTPELAEQCELLLGDEPLETFHYFRRRKAARHMTPRIVLGSQRRLAIGCTDPRTTDQALDVSVIVWRPDRARYRADVGS